MIVHDCFKNTYMFTKDEKHIAFLSWKETDAINNKKKTKVQI